MLEEIYHFFNNEMLYLWINLGVIPFWLLLIFLPQSYLSRYLATSIFPVLLLSSTYVFVLYNAYLNSFDFDQNFSLYLGLSYVSELFSESYFLLMFWIHFVSINLFVGGWMIKDSNRFTINKVIMFFPLVITYFIGPIGIFIYWIIKIIRAKRMGLFD
tara:strand:- start:180 stop:653 length:474 start_codon:yes stop_codon:yes gene_type:complete